MDVTIEARVMEPTDRELAGRVRSHGDEAAFRLLYRRHTPRLWAVALRMLGGDAAREEAEEAVQDAWVRAVRGLAGFRWESSFSTWLTGIALNRCRETVRRRMRRREVAVEGVGGEGGGAPGGGGAGGGVARAGIDGAPLAAATDPGRRLDLEQAIAALPDGYRTVLVLHDVEGFTHEEISDRLSIAVGTSRSQLLRARRAMRRLLSEGEGDVEG